MLDLEDVLLSTIFSLFKQNLPEFIINAEIMVEKQTTIPARDGYPLACIVREPEIPRKGVVQIHSGTGIPKELYAHFAQYLTQEGYVTITFDYRGIGGSSPENLKGFDAKTTDWGALDMAGVFDWVLEKYPSDKKIIAAHSMGGQMVGLMDNNDKIDQLKLIASSTGYWRDMSSPYKWILPPVWFLFIPLTTSIFGYANTKKVKQGEDLPKGVALQWRNWCVNPNYFDDELQALQQPLYFDQLTCPVEAIQISDDPIANEVTVSKLLKYYTNAPSSVKRVRPVDVGLSKIGHTGFFSRKVKDSLWKGFVASLN